MPDAEFKEPARHAKPKKKVNESETRSQRSQERRLFYSNIRLQSCISVKEKKIYAEIFVNGPLLMELSCPH